MSIRPRAAVGLFSLLASVASAAPGKPSYEDLVANLKSPNPKTRQEAAAALGKTGRRDAVAPLAALVRDPEVKVRAEVVRALRELRDPSAVPALCTSVGDGDPEIRRDAVSGLVEVYAGRQRSGPIARFLQVFSDEFNRASVAPNVSVDPQAFSTLSRALLDEDRQVREAAALAIGILGGSGVAGDLVRALNDPDPGVRGAAAIAIGKVGSEADGRALIPLLADESSDVRNRALYAIGVLKVKDAGPALRELYELNRRKDFGLRVLETLARIGDRSQADLFVELVQDPEPERKRLAVEGLGRVSDTARLTAFKKDFQREGNEEVKLAYAFAITLLGDRAFLDTIVLSLPSRTLGARSRAYLLEMGGDVLRDLYAYLGDPDAAVRGALCEIIGQIGDPAAIERLTPLLSDPNAGVADRANRAVERLRRTPPSAAGR